MTTKKYTWKAGVSLGSGAGDSGVVEAQNADEALDLAIRLAIESAPDSDQPYRMVVWIEDRDGTVIASEDVVAERGGIT